ncbi:polysaccharide biosynthesis/export family protein [Sphingomonas sp. ZB1N12]|jgi:polysaccharide export outer membrane protein
MRATLIGVVALSAMLGACADDNIGPNLRTGEAAYETIPAPVGEPRVQDYRIGALDTLDIIVFQEADISTRGVVVDAAGVISMPLIGRIQAAGNTSTQLADLLAAKLAERFYVNPQVTVTVASSVAQRVTVQGDVKEPGIYPISGPTTLLDTVALAKGESEDAALREVIVIRYIDGKRMGAVFDLKRIRRGDDADPAIAARDTIIVGHSTGKSAWHDILRAAPLLAGFGVFAQF